MPSTIYATLKVLGDPATGIPDEIDWSTEHRLGIRMPEGKQPDWAFFRPGQRMVVYDARHRTVCAIGRQVGRTEAVWPPEYGCRRIVRFQAEVAITQSAQAPALADVLSSPPDIKQKSYVRLSPNQYDLLRQAVGRHPAAVQFDTAPH